MSILADSPSPFLRHGAEQPVNWLPWGDAAFERARREDRAILLDIGGVWCHWCHVMDRESYEDEETAGLINEHFVPVKVDRDERPDVDARYQRAVQILTGQGGWPLTAFLTPDGEVFYGGTYFPPRDMQGRPGFPRVLGEIARVWKDERERTGEMIQQLRGRLSAYERAEAERGEVSRALVDHGVDAFVRAFDGAHGGFGEAPKFPNAGAIELLLDAHLDGRGEGLRRVVTRTLDGMGRGGVYDQLGGGFHRYSTDARWLVPHFEKMGYDNGVLLGAYARAHAATGEAFYRDVADGIVRYYRELEPELVERGGFPASQDADVGPEDDGDYWTWTEAEVRDALADGANGGAGGDLLFRAAKLRFGLDDAAATMPSDRSRHVLYLASEIAAVARRLDLGDDEAAALLAEVRDRLRAARAERERPFVDVSVYAGWSALVASGHLAAARYCGRADAAAAGLRALDRIWDEAFDAEDGVAHRVGRRGGAGYLEDQAYVAEALVDAFELTQEARYLERARAVARVMLERFLEPESGAFLDRPRGAASAVAALDQLHLPITDSPMPAPNAVAARVLLRLDALGDGAAGSGARWPQAYASGVGASAADASGADSSAAGYRAAAMRVLAAFAGTAQRLTSAMATYARAVDWATGPVTTIVVVGDEGDAGTDALFEAALRTYRPRSVLRRFESGAVPEGELPPALAAMLTGRTPRAYVCAERTCAEPVAESDALVELLRRFRG